MGSKSCVMIDPNNRPGGATLVLTAKSADKIQFFDAATLSHLADIGMPGSTHELVLSPDRRQVYGSVYGGGIFGKNVNPDRRIAVIDLAAKSLGRLIDIGDNLAPHSLTMDARGVLWSTAELGAAVLAIDPDSGEVERINVGGAPHWIAVSHTNRKLFASFKTKEMLAVLDTDTHRIAATIAIPHGAEGIAVSPDGETLFVCAHHKGVVHVFHSSISIAAPLPSAVRPARRGSFAACVSHQTVTMSVSHRMSTTSLSCTTPPR